MVTRLNNSDPEFEVLFEALNTSKRDVASNVDAVVADILENVKSRGDEALLEYCEKFDRINIEASDLRIKDSEIEIATGQIPTTTMDALILARDRIKSHHERQVPQDDRYTDAIGVELGTKWTPVDAVGLYVPGGTASYPSSVLMNAIPAVVAGVPRIAMMVPTPDANLNPLVLAAAKLAGVGEIYRIGGAQAVAAFAYGTQSIAPVAKITGPGNAYVAAAKRQVFGTVGIDMIAGPSEVLVIADADNSPDWIAADLLAQAEHDTNAQSILITDNEEFGQAVEKAVENQLKTLPREKVARPSWENHGAIIVLDNLDRCPDLVNQLAPEHLEIATENPEILFAKINNAGSVFLGRHTPEAIGDYVAGPNHVLPTARSARFSSGLSVLDFMKKTSFLKCGSEQLTQIGPAAVTLAEVEGLQAHGKSVSIRMNR